MKIVWSRRARAHLVHIRNYLAQDSPAAAVRVAARIVETVEYLARQPNIGRSGRITGTRELVISGTPYIAHYRIRGNRVEIIAIFHGRQKWPKS